MASSSVFYNVVIYMYFRGFTHEIPLSGDPRVRTTYNDHMVFKIILLSELTNVCIISFNPANNLMREVTWLSRSHWCGYGDTKRPTT